ncbi:MAG: septum formation initiator family protein [Spirochaetota bacterium]
MTVIIKIIKMTVFFGVVFLLLFCITWQNINMYLLNKKIEDLQGIKNDLQKSIYLKKIELYSLSSRERVKHIAREKLGMVPVSYRDFKMIVY